MDRYRLTTKINDPKWLHLFESLPTTIINIILTGWYAELAYLHITSGVLGEKTQYVVIRAITAIQSNLY